MGYLYQPWVRFTPKNGAVETWKLSEKFTDVEGPAQCRVDYVLDFAKRTDLNRQRGQIHHGFRPRVHMVLDIWTMEDQAHHAFLINRLVNPELCTVDLALDAGLTWRPVLMERSPDGPDPLGGKVFVGARFVLDLEARSLIPEYPDLVADPVGVREFLSDGGLESWSSATDLREWIKSITNGSSNQDATVAHEGNYSARLDRTTATDGSLHVINANRVLAPDSWYRLRFWYRGDFTAAVNGAAWRLYNVTQNTALQNDGSWGTPGAQPLALAASGTWYEHVIPFQVPAAYGAADAYNVELRHHYGANNGQSVWFDRSSLLGPIRPTGVNAW